ncbi:winged helix-turn-helix domain-containing protein [Nocardia pseudobrasiliensis]|uniref:ArsR family transcriptional regulator n=1 Tax=Nocardia pseudobrasiliensis TaxID=45979 RepID=A0A370HYC4_9NOCA|nr:helix-turn-helix domain-containing protein [Nocardia pseudobrasiliensis]RDI63507.1 ArsR family transcriptional regulator [Nocardia pseudobrasiliensis]
MADPTATHLGDPRALRAYAHPTRLALVAALRRDGPMTATRAATLVGESVASCSFHLRQLAKYGLVEEAGGGRGREKPWRATALVTHWDGDHDDPTTRAAATALNIAVAERYAALMAAWLRTRPQEDPAWRAAAQFGDTVVPLTAAELAHLGARIEELIHPYLRRLTDPSTRPADARPVALLHVAFPSDRLDHPPTP